MDLSSCILPYPYEAYSRFNRYRVSFKDHKNQIYKWVEENTSKSNINNHIDYVFNYLKDSKHNKDIKDWFLNHLDKLKYIGDFSGLDFGVNFDEESEEIYIRFPQGIEEEDKQLYPLYDEKTFINLEIIDKLEWMYEHCEFIPFRIIYEDIEVGYVSHKFSHIKRNIHIMDLLKKYLENVKFPPNDNVYYCVRFSRQNNRFYLERDLGKSPKSK